MTEDQLTEDQLKEKLNGKRILFVDDAPLTLTPVPAAMSRLYGVTCEFIKDLVRAKERLADNKPPVHVVILDLKMDNYSYQGFDKTLKLGLHNKGQLLGVWLYQQKFPYLYLTGIEEAFDRTLPGQDKVVVLSKYDATRVQLAHELVGLLADTPEVTHA
ncbi:MAG: hypothetical protein H7839_02115 [Magnetococcus sp. YQC-5]